ncbi:plasma kallikrein isoform X1 [Python bivittatus]|uniref:Plasma kallikrein isoform X1 n=1 Tax=Python bivittatus TaxID=176946 RepID=A0A9F3W035_PYTBI|nr:plasma kallikrein isoform X1 [Python bivittatus]
MEKSYSQYSFCSRMFWISQALYFTVLFSSARSECMSKIYRNTYIQGGDISKVYTPTADYCQMVCTYHPRCLLFSYIPGNWAKNTARFSCFLKEIDTQELPKVPQEGIISGHSLKQCTQITACSKKVYEGLDMQGENYNITTADNYHRCQQRCTNDKHCYFFTYTLESFHSPALRNKCYLKYSSTGTPTQIRQLRDVVSGFSLKPCQLAQTDCQMDFFQHFAFSGITVAKVLTPDKFVCRTVCTYRPNCLFFTFFSSEWEIKSQRYTCLMMTSRSETPDRIAERANAISGFSLLNCQRAEPACHSQTYPELNFHGTELSVEYVDGHKACQELCTMTLRCQFFIYVFRKMQCNHEGKCKCYLRMSANGSPDNIEAKNEIVSGYSLRLCQTSRSPVCVQKPKQQSRIVGGSNSSVGEWPWQVSLHTKLSIQSHHCGGSIISDQWILTAAHCLEDIPLTEHWHVYSNILKQSEITNETTFFKVQKMIIHPRYEISEAGYDIALLKLDTPMNFSVLQQPVCLPSQEEMNMAKYTECWVTGWGYTKERGTIEDTLQKVKIPIMPNAECQFQYPEHRITDKMLCAGYPEGGKDACQGDSGGPMSCKFQNSWYLVGITSWGEGCARPGQPGVYTNVAKFVDWILEQTLED